METKQIQIKQKEPVMLTKMYGRVPTVKLGTYQDGEVRIHSAQHVTTNLKLIMTS